MNKKKKQYKRYKTCNICFGTGTRESMNGFDLRCEYCSGTGKILEDKMKKGFTLIEILIVVAILGLLISLVVPQLMFANFKTALEIKDREYAVALWKESGHDLNKAKKLLQRNWRPAIEEFYTPTQVTYTKNLLAYPRCKYVFGKYKLIEDTQ